MRCELVMEERAMPPANNYVIERYMTTTATERAMTMKKAPKMGIRFIFVGASVCERAALAGGGVRFALKPSLESEIERILRGAPAAIARSGTAKLLGARYQQRRKK